MQRQYAYSSTSACQREPALIQHARATVYASFDSPFDHMSRARSTAPFSVPGRHPQSKSAAWQYEKICAADARGLRALNTSNFASGPIRGNNALRDASLAGGWAHVCSAASFWVLQIIISPTRDLVQKILSAFFGGDIFRHRFVDEVYAFQLNSCRRRDNSQK